MPRYYRILTIEAVLWTGENWDELCEFVQGKPLADLFVLSRRIGDAYPRLYYGDTLVCKGNYIVRTSDGLYNIEPWPQFDKRWTRYVPSPPREEVSTS